ncbi:unnamed protein product [Allacma fusca]|uniref:Uncharacterized protein n=1 Tax=Allacma fusca TaxID=39272 RepID=A0A8J2LLP3_9HEXA|nr:unnamed protein product [Allacma fusca]
MNEFIRSRQQLLNLYCFKANDTKLAIKRFLIHPKTAFLTNQKSFPYYWKIFQNYMESSESTVRFAHNGKFRDDSLSNLTSMQGLCFTRTVGILENVVLKRTKIMFSSGIFKLWETSQHPLGNVAEVDGAEVSIGDAKSLSLINSDISTIFITFCWMLLACTAIFLMELQIWSKISKVGIFGIRKIANLRVSRENIEPNWSTIRNRRTGANKETGNRELGTHTICRDFNKRIKTDFAMITGCQKDGHEVAN